jgi:glycolate oxidase FAD binding subunit
VQSGQDSPQPVQPFPLRSEMPEGILQVDGIQIERHESPTSAEELASIIRETHSRGLSVIPIGGGTQLHLGNPPKTAHLGLHTSNLRGIVEYEPGNLTVTVRAGTPLQELQDALGRENQFLPLDPPHPERATLGGIVAANTSGPIRFRYSTVRDMLIGIRTVHADGTQTRAGGKLVKNVTGYDMCKLYAGSLGTLGIFSEMTFKVQPASEAIATGVIGYPALRPLMEFTQASLRADVNPDALEAWNARAWQALPGSAGTAPWILMVRFGETDASVRWQVDRMHEIAASTGGTILNVTGSRESHEFWRAAASAREIAGTGDELWLKCSVLYRAVPEIERRMIELGEQLGAQARLYCHAGTIVLFGRYDWPDGKCGNEELVSGVLALRRHCAAAGGHLVVEKARPQAKRALDVWGYDEPALALMRAIKTQFDPTGVLNPGRFVGGM